MENVLIIMGFFLELEKNDLIVVKEDNKTNPETSFVNIFDYTDCSHHVEDDCIFYLNIYGRGNEFQMCFGKVNDLEIEESDIGIKIYLDNKIVVIERF